VGCLGVELWASRFCGTGSRVNIVQDVEFIRWMLDGFDKKYDVSNFINGNRPI